MTNLYKIRFSSLLKKSGLVFILRLIGMVLSYIAILFISNNYGAEVFGRFSLAQTLLQLLILVFSLGLTTAIVKLTSDENFFKNGKPINTYLKNALQLLLASSVVCAVIIYFSRNWLASYVFNDIKLGQYFRYISFFIPFAIFHTFLLGFVQAKKKFIKFGLLMYVMPYALFILFLLISVYYKLDESTTILSYLTAFLLISIFLIFELPIKKINPQYSYGFKQILTLSFPMMFSAAFIFIANWTDVFMLGLMTTKQELGIYNAAFKLAIITVVVINAVNTVLAPKIAQLYSENNILQIKMEVQKATKLITYISVPIVVILILFRKQFLSLFGDEFLEAETTLIIISMGLLFNALSGSVGQVLNMTSHQKELRNITLLGGLSNIFLNYFLIKSMGINGAALASVITNLLINILCLIYIKRKFNFYAFYKP